MNELHLFAGIGGGVLAGELLGHTPIGAVEINPYCRRVLRRHYPNLPIHDDIKTFKPWHLRGHVDIVAGGFPCQDISAAGNGAGLAGARSGLWFEMLRVVEEVEPLHVFVENSPLLRSRGLGEVLRGLADLGFDAQWDTLAASDVGAPHWRKRLWLLATHTDPDRRRRASERQSQHDDQQSTPRREPDGLGEAGRRHWSHLADARGARLPLPQQEELRRAWRRIEGGAVTECSWWAAEPDVGRVAHGVPSRVDRLRALGNAQVPLQAAYAFKTLKERSK